MDVHRIKEIAVQINTERKSTYFINEFIVGSGVIFSSLGSMMNITCGTVVIVNIVVGIYFSISVISE